MKRRIFLFLLFFFTSINSIHAHQDPNNTVVHMTQNGYVPKNIEINQGTTIVFENTDIVDLWPASNIHPTHNIYSDFDPKKSIKPGESWKFTFNTPGEWKYHDHLFPTIGGTIIVNEVSDSINASKSTTLTPSSTPKPKNKILEIKSMFWKIVYIWLPQLREKKLAEINMHSIASNPEEIQFWLQTIGGKSVMEELIKDSTMPTMVDCHQEAHQIGRYAFEIFGSVVFRINAFDCHSGFIHGAMESFLIEKGTQNLAKNIDTLCNELKTSFGNFECLHGVGHGVMTYENYDLPASLSKCQELSTGFAQSSCYGGVFMENIMLAEGKGANPDHETKWTNDDPHFPCNSILNSYPIQYECYMMQTSRMLYISGYNFDYVQNECLKAPKDLISVCFRSMGRDLAGQTLRESQKIKTRCEQAPSEYVNDCLQGALNVIVDFWGDKLNYQAHELCKIVETDSQKSHCYNTLSSRLVDVFGNDKPKIKLMCQEFESNYQNTCNQILITL